jgi:hypothetical protein
MENESGNLSVSPNPFNDLIQLESSEVLKTIVITDLSSRIVFEKSILASSCQLNLEVLPTGVYILHTLTEHGTRKASRIVKQ